MKAIRHFGIVTSNLKRSLHFYRDILGLKISKQMTESGEYIDKISGLKAIKVTTIKMAAEDGNLIELLYYHSHPKKNSRKRKLNNVGASHVAFTVENIDAEYKRLKKLGVNFNSKPQLSPDGFAKVTFCKDPDSVFIELVEML